MSTYNDKKKNIKKKLMKLTFTKKVGFCAVCSTDCTHKNSIYVKLSLDTVNNFILFSVILFSAIIPHNLNQKPDFLQKKINTRQTH